MDIKKVKELKGKMEKDIAAILMRFESETGLKPGTVFSERVEQSIEFIGGEVVRGEMYYRVNIPIHL